MDTAKIARMNEAINQILKIMKEFDIKDVTSIGICLLSYAILRTDSGNYEKYEMICDCANHICECICEKDKDFSQYVKHRLLQET